MNDPWDLARDLAAGIKPNAGSLDRYQFKGETYGPG